MKVNKKHILNNICYTEIVYGRINKKLGTQLSKRQIERYIHKILEETDEQLFLKRGKNYYVQNAENNTRITINSNKFRIITVDKLDQLRK